MLKEEGSEARGRELKSRRERELEELRSRGVAKTRREKLKFYSAPLNTAIESKRFLLQCHDESTIESTKESTKESSFRPKFNPSTVSAVDYNSFLMQQSKRQRELKMRRREAEQLLHGFRGFYGESFASWSPRHARQNSRERFSFGAEDALRDPEEDSSRRDTSFSQMEREWGLQEERDDSSSRYSKRFIPNPLDPHRRDFLIDDRHYDGTKYSRTDQDMEVSSGVSMFSPRNDNRYRDRPPLSARSSTSGRRAREFFKSPTSTSGGNFESDANGFARTLSNELETTPSKDFSVGFDENEFRERAPSTTRSSASGGKLFFKSPTSTSGRSFSRGFASSPYEPRRMKLYTPTSAASQGDFAPDGFPVGFDEDGARQFQQTSGDQENREPATSSSSPYEAPRMQLYTPTGASIENFERTSGGFAAEYDGNSNHKFELTSEKSEDSVPSASASQYEKRRRSHDPSGASGVDFERKSDGASDGFNEDRINEYDQNGKLRNSEDPDGRDPESYREQRMKLQINTQREEVIDVSASEERLRDADDDVAVGRWKAGREEIYSGPSQDSTLSEPKIPEEAVVPEPQKAPVPETIWRDFISDEPGAKFPPEAGRYHLYASYACPGSHRALIVRALKGLEDVVSITIVHPTWRQTNPQNPKDKHRGWIFGDPDGEPFHNTMGRGGPFPPAYPGNDPDPVLNAYSVRNLYEHAKDTSGKYTIPLLWDTKLNTIVNNESSDISYMLNSSFNKFAKKPELDLYTEDDDEGLDRLNEVSQWLYPMMIHGVYRCGFAKTQKAYDRAIDELTAAFDAADALLREQRYLTGNTLTDADIRFFVTLIRFDEVYAFYFRANTRLVLMTPSLLNFCREIYQMPGVADTCQMDQIKAHFFGSHAEWNKYSVVPRGLDFMRYLEMPHNRDEVDTYGHF